MSAVIEQAVRQFRYGGMVLRDLFPEITDVKQALLEAYGKQYPELHFAEIGVGNDNEGKLEFEIIKKSLGTKG
ncbi:MULTISPECIES: PRTRC system protein C [Vibrio]|uniref:PRTRC system protein C n=1 Tax=Vibrio TaxID=662 RepID=UPI00078C4ECA|nr:MULTISPECIES: PRTRC system protein C [Vibrio]BAU70947.1 hypothetical protein [Vibrio sp. 04Ya108]BBM67795.1 hypothetical protein VA249_44410 [Vibrio alfacsensis]BCN26966.1 hypothetical protein VYA_41580 [Vibrio alfacsensis]